MAKKNEKESAKKNNIRQSKKIQSSQRSGSKKKATKSASQSKARANSAAKPLKKQVNREAMAASKKSGVPQKRMDKKSTSSRQEINENSKDIIDLILKDHIPIKKLIKIMKDDESEKSELEKAFEEFAPILINHAKPEELTLYVRMKDEEDMRTTGFEGDIEHRLADQLIEEIERTEDEDEWRAKVKVLAELVEHHVEEEEDEMLPEFRKHTDQEERNELGTKYLELREEMEATGNDDSASEKHMSADDENEEDAQIDADEDEDEDDDDAKSPSHHV